MLSSVSIELKMRSWRVLLSPVVDLQWATILRALHKEPIARRHDDPGIKTRRDPRTESGQAPCWPVDAVVHPDGPRDAPRGRLVSRRKRAPRGGQCPSTASSPGGHPRGEGVPEESVEGDLSPSATISRVHPPRPHSSTAATSRPSRAPSARVDKAITSARECPPPGRVGATAGRGSAPPQSRRTPSPASAARRQRAPRG